MAESTIIVEVGRLEDLGYRRLGILGSGGFGEVEEVINTTTQDRFAHKKLLVRRRDLAQTLEVFRREIRIIRRLQDHHHFIKLQQAYQTNDSLGMLIYPVADSGSLEDYMANSAQTTVLKNAVGCLAEGLEHMHTVRRVRHKDIKPGNVLIHQGLVLFSDLGLSQDFSKLSRDITNGPHRYWTPKYATPE
ncbi:kinase-like protein [Plenodomus tracheiphilus IPT5]|uniref:Kinase-like protein n=1 Tax=Plenodomus tracheiphilus IPT5 TaxID=1408161 RepID=A0A6A7B303_9PLEO|nr:kinase-like protein [Plenodomus tracheiphilus IPT5]